MSIKEFVQKFYKSDALIDSELLKEYIHPDIIVEWRNSQGIKFMNYQDMLDYTSSLSKNFVRSKVRIQHILEEGDLVSLHFSHYGNTIENPREETLLAQFMVVWQIKDDKLYRGYQMSYIS